MPRRTAAPKTTHTAATLGFEAKLWAAADALRYNINAAENKRVQTTAINPPPVAGGAPRWLGQIGARAPVVG
jgi:hypothetical protein